MNIQRFTGATAREALAKARMAFGEGTLILSNRPTALGVEVMATAEDSLQQLDQRTVALTAGSAKARVPQRPLPVMTSVVASGGASSDSSTVTTASRQQVEDDTAQLAMSTLSFQDYVRERMLRRRQTENPARADETAVRTQAAPAHAQAQAAAHVSNRPTAAPAKTLAAHPQPIAYAARPSPVATPAPLADSARSIADELQSMRDLIEDRFTTFAWLGQARQHPIQSHLMLKLMRAGYSPLLARTVLERMPEPLAAAESMQWMLDAIERNLKTTSPTQAIHDEGGCYALVGATGVGKTTTVAKLAGLCAATHGAASVGMVTLDTRRVGAYDQLREHGRSLGIVAHLAHDQAALQDLLGLLANKKLILIDTTGLVPRDPHKDESLEVLDLPGVKRLLVLNAGAHGDTLDEVVSAFKSGGIQQAVLSKIDEAVKLGPALDVTIRHQLLLRGVTTGQKVPQDWDNADARELVRQSMSTIGKSAFDPKPVDLGFFFMQPDQRPQVPGRRH